MNNNKFRIIKFHYLTIKYWKESMTFQICINCWNAPERHLLLYRSVSEIGTLALVLLPSRHQLTDNKLSKSFNEYSRNQLIRGSSPHKLKAKNNHIKIYFKKPFYFIHDGFFSQLPPLGVISSKCSSFHFFPKNMHPTQWMALVVAQGTCYCL